MMNLRTFFITIILVPWMLSSAARNGNMEARKPKKEVVTIPDYDTTGDSDTSPAAAPKEEELPTCLLCVCLTGSVYCEVSPEMTAVPSLPKETAYLRTLQQNDQNHHQNYAHIATLRRIDLTGNQISEIEDGAFSKLALLEELNISELAKNLYTGHSVWEKTKQMENEKWHGNGQKTSDIDLRTWRGIDFGRSRNKVVTHASMKRERSTLLQRN
nr:mimecan-like [Oncorhynchus nerka]